MSRESATCPQFIYPTDKQCLNIYLAGKFSDGDRMEKLADRLQVELSACVTFRWWNYPQTPTDERGILESITVGNKEACGILDADLVIAIMDDPEYLYRETSTEIGICIGSKIPIFVVCPTTMDFSDPSTYPDWARNPFNHLSSRYFSDIDDIINHIEVRRHAPLYKHIKYKHNST